MNNFSCTEQNKLRREHKFTTLSKIKTISRRNFTMNENSYGCTPNKAIKCNVKQCANHCEGQDYCALNNITVATHEANPTEVKCTDCESFKLS